jgi:hypothetical protein
LAERWNCYFSNKVENAANMGASAIIIYNNGGSDPYDWDVGGDIHAVGIRQSDGHAMTEFASAHDGPTVTIHAP